MHHTLSIKLKQVLSFIHAHKTALLFTAALTLSGLLHGINMLEYPYHESDEGTYVSQAWSLNTSGELAPYTYWYDHPPLGWILIAGWFALLPNEHFTFGTSIDTARVLMLIIHLISSALLFFITKRITKSDTASFLSVLLINISPIAIYFQRRVLLDNIMTVWLLASIAVLLRNKLTLREYMWSGLFYAFAFLTKVTAAVFGPSILFLVYAIKDTTHRGFRMTTWLVVSILTTSTFGLYALIKGELFPSANSEHVSLLGSILFQANRGANIPFYAEGSDFMLLLQDYLNRDATFIIISAISILIVALSILIKRSSTQNTHIVFVLSIIVFYMIFLMRGGIVINFYIIPLLPFLALAITLASIEIGKGIAWIWLALHEKVMQANHMLIKKVERTVLISGTLAYITISLLLWYGFSTDKKFLYANEVRNQRSAAVWIKQNLPEQSDIVIDAIMLVELRDPNYINNKVFQNAEWFYKVSRDPAIRYEKFNNNWKSLDYIALTHEMLKQIGTFPKSDIVLDAYLNALPIAKWFEDSSSFIDEPKKITTNGDWAMVYAINNNSKAQLVDSWEYYKKNFIHSYGQTIDPFGNVTTSEGQSYALLRSVWMNDEETFKGSWLWTKHHLQHRLDDNLISWKWTDGKLADSANATDADQDIALALIFASKVFREPNYLLDAQRIINDLWKYAVIQVDGTLYMLPMTESLARREDGILFNPSYLSPAHYRIFAQVDPYHDWLKLADDTYKTLRKIQNMETATPLPRNWYLIDTKTGSLSSAEKYIGPSSDHYSYDAFRTIWRVWLDHSWFGSEDAERFLIPIATYASRFTDGTSSLPTIINPNTGSILSQEPSLAIQTGYLLALASQSKSNTAAQFYKNIINSSYNEAGYWGDRTNYYNQNWVWFASAVFNNDVYNLYTSQ